MDISDDEASSATPEWELIADYVSGQADDIARARVKQRMERDSAFRADVAAARLAWDRARATAHPVTDTDTERAWQRLAREIETATPTGPARIRDGRTRRLPARWRLAAAAASLAVAAGIGALLMDRGIIRLPGSAANGEWREIVTQRGQRIAVTLEDGGRVMLAPGSTLRIPVEFNDTERRVVLSGRAYFEVAHDPSRPFTVRTSEATVRVLGTEFDMTAHSGGRPAQVIVRSGSVAVMPAADTLERTVLGRGELATVEHDSVDVESGVDVDALLAWTSGRLVFERTALSEVIADLERWYDIDITADSTLLDRRLTAAFDREPLDIVLETVATLVDARVRRDNATVTLTPDAPR